MKKSAVIVTGGAGYIGSHTCNALYNAGFLPIAVDNLCLGHKRFVQWGPLIEIDIRETNKLMMVIDEYNPVGLMHFAAYAYVGESVEHPMKYYHNNVGGIMSVLSAMIKTNLNNLVFSSTCAVYGEVSETPITEDTVCNPINPYGRSKYMCEQIINDCAAAYGLNAVILRYFNAAGADEFGNLGESREIETHIIPRAMQHLQGYCDDFEVFGNDFDTVDGTAIRDYIHVSDLADAHVLALMKLESITGTKIFNLGTGNGYSVKEVLSAISKESGTCLDVSSGKRRSGDPAELIADASLAFSELSFTPKRSNLNTIIKTSWDWHVKNYPKKN